MTNYRKRTIYARSSTDGVGDEQAVKLGMVQLLLFLAQADEKRGVAELMYDIAIESKVDEKQ
ncbi:hypothetical protein [Microcoleus vaginatus]|uniref:hypothetical protein n=1 Tax=Microcoleus vaginatus TaxID=119532 RepID=UPI0032AC2D3A